MQDVIQFIENSPLLTTIIGTVLATVIISLRGIMKKKEISDTLVIDSQRNFIDLNKKWISKGRKLISQKAFEFNHIILKDDAFIQNRDYLPLLAKKEWIPDHPIPIQSVKSELVEEVVPKIKPRTDILPYSSKTKRFSEYHAVIEELIKPPVFYNNRHYRLMDISMDEKSAKFDISKEPNSYFNKIDYGKTAELEFTDAIKTKNKLESSGLPGNLQKLPSKSSQKYRVQLLNTFKQNKDFSNTVILGGVSTLTLIQTKEGNFRFLMHLRSDDQGYAESTRHVVPAGEFQPINEGNNFETDSNILYNILREYAEEIEGIEEITGKENQRYDYETNPLFKKYFEAINKGDLKIYYLGFGLDPLSLQGEHMTCAIFKEDSFLKLFGSKVKSGNYEGEIISDSNIWGMEFNESNIQDQLMGNILSAGEAIIMQVRKHLSFLKKDFSS
ncbi:MAG: hypothetical protein JJ971_09780 [Balneolaceae bacterium]|nr:hypothetical protein [Balneolaceae bacterium]